MKKRQTFETIQIERMERYLQQIKDPHQTQMAQQVIEHKKKGGDDIFHTVHDFKRNIKISYKHSERQQKFVELIKLYPKINKADLAELTHLSNHQSNKFLKIINKTKTSIINKQPKAPKTTIKQKTEKIDKVFQAINHIPQSIKQLEKQFNISPYILYQYCRFDRFKHLGQCKRVKGMIFRLPPETQQINTPKSKKE